MADAIFDQGQLGAAAQALMQRRQMLAAQEAAAMGQGGMQGMPGMAPMGQTAMPGSVPGMQPMQPQAMQPMGSPQAAMPQSQFSGYGGPQMTPQQRAKLAAMLQARDGQPQ